MQFSISTFNRPTHLLAVLCFLVCPGTNSLHAQSIGWKFAEGDSFSINLQQSSSVQTIVDRREVNQSNEMTLEMNWVVESVDGDNAKIKQTITRVVTSLTMPGKEGQKTIAYDSNEEKFKADAKRLAASFSCIVNQPITITMTTRGEVTDVEVPEATLESLRQMPGSMQGRKMFEPDAIREMFMQAGMQLPEPDAGASWETNRKFSIGTPQQFSQTLKYSIADANAKPLEITFTGNIVAVESEKEVERPEGIEFDSLEIENQDSSGTIIFDAEKGNCQSSKSSTMLKTRTGYRDMQVVATINSSQTMKIERK